MNLTSVAQELYGLTPREFTAARDAYVAEARQAGDKDLVAALKTLRKPTVGAWMANRLVRDRLADIDDLIGLGEELRRSSTVDGEQIRRVSKKKQEAVAKLVRRAQQIAQRAGQSVSQAAALDLEATLDAAFGDPSAAASLREGCLTTTLSYSGLGFAADGPTGTTAPQAQRKRAVPGAVVQAETALDQTTRAAEEAEVALKTALSALSAAEADLKRLRAAATVAERRATKAHEDEAAARKRLDALRRASDR